MKLQKTKLYLKKKKWMQRSRVRKEVKSDIIYTPAIFASVIFNNLYMPLFKKLKYPAVCMM